MKAITLRGYGGPELLKLEDVDKPNPGANDVLIRNHAEALNAADWHLMRGSPLVFRLMFGFTRPKNPIIGADIAGTVEAVGSGVTKFKPGDQVYADLSGASFGAFAEYVAAPAEIVASKPSGISLTEAAAIPLAGVTALQAVNKHGPLRAGQSVLVNGASGGVGHFAVQIAKAAGAVVTGVCSGRNADLVRGIGADEVIDYTKEDFTRLGRSWDLVLDAVGNQSLGAIRRAIGENGKAVMIGFGSMTRLMSMALMGGKNVAIISAKANASDLDRLAKLAEDGKLSPQIEKVYPLAELPAAMAQLETGRVRGKLAVEIG